MTMEISGGADSPASGWGMADAGFQASQWPCSAGGRRQGPTAPAPGTFPARQNRYSVVSAGQKGLAPRTRDPEEQAYRQMAKVSIGIPVYNGENYLQEAIDGILNQSFRDLDILICD